MEKRIKKIFGNLDTKPDVVLVKNSTEPYIDDNFFYVTSLEHGLFEGSAAVLFPDGKIDLIVSELESESASKTKANLKIYKEKNEFNNHLKESLKSVSSVGLNFNRLLLRDFLKFKDLLPNMDFLNVSQGFTKTRVVKDDDELEKIRRATQIADNVMKKIPDVLSADMYEYELAGEINYLLQKNGADKPAFDTISSFGRNSAEPHYSHGNTQLKNGDFVLCDFGASYHRYNSDITRTFVFGKASEKQKKMHKTVLDAQQVGFEKIRDGVMAHEVHEIVDDFINKSEFKGCFIHNTGHSLGLAVHDSGVGFSLENNIRLAENMVLTVEPGVYISGFGGVRIEDDIIVKKDGIELLTKTTRDLIEI